uniref:Uncharacterized protein n=1 Tax=Pristhesancus plagipennis TaxID=1955184 RepID=A0A2K8JLY0_PRIPG|nr:secreted hypothetical protein [Pristhesancus plagipennis]
MFDYQFWFFFFFIYIQKLVATMPSPTTHTHTQVPGSIRVTSSLNFVGPSFPKSLAKSPCG